MARTRSTRPAAGKKKDAPVSSSAASVKRLDASVEQAPQVFLLPEHTSSDARIVTIPTCASLKPSRYLICPIKGFYEFTRVAAPRTQNRSWLLAPKVRPEHTDVTPKTHAEDSGREGHAGYVLQTPDMLVATPIDPLFILLPSLLGDGEGAGLEYLAACDYLAKLSKTSKHLAQLLSDNTAGRLEQVCESRIAAVCDCMDVGGDRMYALSLRKLVRELASKAKRMSTKGLPASLEDRFVKQELTVPILSVRREESSVSIATDNTSALSERQISEAQSQETAASDTTAATNSTKATSLFTASSCDSASASEGVTHLLRIRVALNFLLTSYVPSAIKSKIEPLIYDPKASGIDFTPLNKKLEYIASVRKEAQALRSLSDNISRKRSAMDEDETSEMAEAKKRKKEEEENRKKNVSLGVKKLMKADTSGMKKLSSFFAKSIAKK